ncbi:hypothetical protein Landi51_02037 [Colletotrichum acutatum]
MADYVGTFMKTHAGELDPSWQVSARDKFSEKRRVKQASSSLPDIVEETEEYVDIYDDDPRVWRAAEDLYLGILDGVESMLQWIDKSALGKNRFQSYGPFVKPMILLLDLTFKERAFKVLTRPTTFGKNVEEETIKQNIEGSVAKFRNVVLMSQHKHINKSLKALKEQLNSQLKYADWVRGTLGNENCNFDDPKTIDNPKAEKLVIKAFITLDELRASIGFDPKINQKDMVTSMIDAQKVCPPEMISHAMLALRDNKFTSWLQSNESQRLFIEGRMKLNSEQEAASPLTMLSCALAQLVARESERSIPLVYLCGQHNRQNDPHSGASGVLRCWNSLIAESLTPRDVDLSAINLSFIDGVRAQQLGVLCMLFRHLVMAATDKVVFVILDGALWLEVSRHVQGLGDVVLFLNNLVTVLNQQNYGVILKVLITHPSTSNHARRWLPKEP